MKPSERFEPKSDAEMSGDVVVQLMQLFEQHSIDVVVVSFQPNALQLVLVNLQ